ncbi:MAG TPA: HAD family hydrolase, partial [Pinirhizobacter sp.]|nr:HAD family hydrolase [Pinirhizobacter sp.]
MIELVGFDGDDTLWRSQEYFEIASSAFEAIVGQYVDLADLRLHERLLAVEQANMARFGYGAKGMTLSMIEAAVQVTGERISARDIHRIVSLGKDVLDHPVELLPGIRQAVEVVAQSHRVVLITKGD